MRIKSFLPLVALFIFPFIFTQTAFPIDPGIRDSILITGLSFSLEPNSQVKIVASGYHDENLSGLIAPLRYKIAQPDILLDSVRFHPDLSSANIKDTIIDRTKGEITFFGIWFVSSGFPAGTDSFCTMYFTTGPSWDPSINLVIDTFRLLSGQGLAYVDTLGNDIVPYYVFRDTSSCADGHSIINPISAKSIPENETLSFRVSVYPDCPLIPVLSALNLPPNASFFDSGNGSGLFTFTPDYTQSGTYNITFIACDTVACDSETVQITVLCGETKRGDPNGNGRITFPDIVYLVNYLFKNGPTPIPEKCNGDANNDGFITLADIIYLVNYLFKGSPPPQPATCCL